MYDSTYYTRRMVAGGLVMRDLKGEENYVFESKSYWSVSDSEEDLKQTMHV